MSEKHYVTMATGKEILDSYNPFHRLGPKLDDMNEALFKLRAVLSMLLTCDDDTGKGLTLPSEDVSWSLLLLDDLTKQALECAGAAGSHISEAWRKAEHHLGGLVVPVERVSKKELA